MKSIRSAWGNASLFDYRIFKPLAKLVSKSIEPFYEFGIAKIYGKLLQIIKCRLVLPSKPRIATFHSLFLAARQTVSVHAPMHDHIANHDVSIGHSKCAPRMSASAPAPGIAPASTPYQPAPPLMRGALPLGRLPRLPPEPECLKPEGSLLMIEKHSRQAEEGAWAIIAAVTGAPSVRIDPLGPRTRTKICRVQPKFIDLLDIW